MLAAVKNMTIHDQKLWIKGCFIAQYRDYGMMNGMINGMINVGKTMPITHYKRTITQVIPIFIAGIPRIPPSHHHI